MTHSPRRGSPRRGFLRSAGLSLLSWCVTCATLDSMILYNRPRTRGEVADFSRRGLRAIIRNYDIFGGCTADAVRPLSLYADVPRQDTDDEQRGGRLGRCRDAGEPIGWRDAGDAGEASPRADLGGGWGGCSILSDEADRMTASTDGGRPSLYGRDCAGMLGDYAADYAALELFGATNSTLYRIVCRWIAG